MCQRLHCIAQTAADLFIVERRFMCCHGIQNALVSEIRDGFEQQLVLAADQYIIPHTSAVRDISNDTLIAEICLDLFDICHQPAAVADNRRHGHCWIVVGVHRSRRRE